MTEPDLALQRPSTWVELRDAIDSQFGQRFANNDFVFRGEPQRYPSVRPQIDRLFDEANGNLGLRLSAELQAWITFRRYAPMRLHGIELEMINEGFQAQILMRHLRAPTRLLDWTESAWVALFFAAMKDPDEDGRVLAVDRTTLRAKVHDRHKSETDAIGSMVANKEGWLVPKLYTVGFAKSCAEWVICYHRQGPAFPRLVAQQGLFTVASKPNLDHWAIAKRFTPDRCREVVVLKELKREVLARLEGMNVSMGTLFPDSEGVARGIAQTLWATSHLTDRP